MAPHTLGTPLKAPKWLVTAVIVGLSLSLLAFSLYYFIITPNSDDSGGPANSGIANTKAPEERDDGDDNAHLPPVAGPDRWRGLPRGYEDVESAVEPKGEEVASPGMWLVQVEFVTSRSSVKYPAWTAYLIAHGGESGAMRTVQGLSRGDAGTQATFASVEPGKYDIQVRADGWIAQDVLDISYDGQYTESTVTLYQLATLECRIIGTSGEPIPDVSVMLYPRQRLLPFFGSADTSKPGIAGETRLVQTSDSEGLARFVDLPPSGDYWLLAGNEDYATKRINNIRINAGADETIEVRLSAGAFITGTVVQYDGQPVPRAAVKAFRPYDGKVDAEINVGLSPTANAIGWIQEGLAWTDDDGWFKIGPLSSGETKLRISRSKDAVALEIQLMIDLQPGEVRDLGVIRPEYPALELVFVFEDVERPDDLHVAINPKPLPEYANEASASGLIGMDVGDKERVTIQNLPPGSAEVFVRSWSNCVEPVRQRVDGLGVAPKTVEIRLRRAVDSGLGPNLSFSVTPRPGNDDFFGAALIFPDTTPVSIRYVLGITPASHGKGAFARNVNIRAHKPGGYIFWATDGTRTGVHEIIVGAGDAERALSVSMDEPAGALDFEVQNTRGELIPDATITWYWDTIHLEDSLQESAFDRPYLKELTDKSGKVRLRGFPVNHPELCFKVSAKGYQTKTVRTASGSTLESPRLELVWLEPASD